MDYLFKRCHGSYFFAGHELSKDSFLELKSVLNSLKSPASFDSFKFANKVLFASGLLEFIVNECAPLIGDDLLLRDLSRVSKTVSYINVNYDSSVKFTDLANQFSKLNSAYEEYKTAMQSVTIDRMSDIFGGGFDDEGEMVIDSEPISRFSDCSLVEDCNDYFFSVNIDGLTTDKRVGEYNGEELSSVSYNRFSRNLSVSLTTVLKDFKLSDIRSRDYHLVSKSISNGVLTVKLSPRH